MEWTENVDIDYRDMDVNAESVMRILTGNAKYGSSRVLNSGPESNVLVYLTGHGGDNFLKFHDQTELMASDLGSAVEMMKKKSMFKNLMIILDTCQASTMYEDVQTTGWFGIASSKRGQSSYALNSDGMVGNYLIDEFTHHLHQYINRFIVSDPNSNPSFQELLEFISRQKLSSEIQRDASKYNASGSHVPILDHFGSNKKVGTVSIRPEQASRLAVGYTPVSQASVNMLWMDR